MGRGADGQTDRQTDRRTDRPENDKREIPRRSLPLAACLGVIPLGFEPKTHSLEGCCSIQLSYGTIGSQRDRRTACGCKYTKSRPIINEFARNYTNRMQIEPRTEGGSQGSDDIPGPSVGDRTPPSPARRRVTGRRPHEPQTGPSEGSAPGKTYRTKKEAPGCGINRIPGSHA